MLKMIEELESNYLLRRLHSLSGLIPIGAFMVFHLFVNSVSYFSAENYNLIIEVLRALPFLAAVEILFIYGPIIFHAAYGIIISKTAKPNQMQYSTVNNWRYFLMRATGMIGLAYLALHMFQYRFVHDLDYNYIASTLAGGIDISFLPQIPLINPLNMYWFYIIGVLSLAFHFSNGLWSFCITWGITVGKKSQTIMSLVSIGVFFVLAFISVTTINGLADAGHALAAH